VGPWRLRGVGPKGIIHGRPFTRHTCEGRVRRGNAPLCGARLHTCVEQQQQRLHTGPAGIQSELDQSAVATIRFTEIRRRNPLTRTILEYLHTYLGELAS
jgi:hypothetical protein